MIREQDFRKEKNMLSLPSESSIHDLVLSYGVMVTQQILVLSFQVRVLVAQQSMLILNHLQLQGTKTGTKFIEFSPCFFCMHLWRKFIMCLILNVICEIFFVSFVDTTKPMPLYSRFLHKDIIAIPKSKLVTGIVTGVAFSLCLYLLLYMSRESLRIFSFTEQFELWILSTKEVWFYNLFIAYISAIFGQSVCMSWWFNYPSKRYGKYKKSLNPVINDLFNLNSFTLSWISKMALVWALFFGWTSFEGHYVIPLYPYYIHVFILIIVVLFFNSWIRIIQSCQVALQEMREEESLRLFGIKLQELEETDFIELVKKHPLFILELTEDMVRNYNLDWLDYEREN